jgi:hypothetical protein
MKLRNPLSFATASLRGSGQLEDSRVKVHRG